MRWSHRPHLSKEWQEDGSCATLLRLLALEYCLLKDITAWTVYLANKRETSIMQTAELLIRNHSNLLFDDENKIPLIFNEV